MLEGRVQEVIYSLVAASCLTVKEQKWVESRCAAIKALTSLYKTETADLSGCMADVLSVDNVHIIYNAFFAAMEDYTLDSRGDVGAGVREASMTGLLQVTSTLTKAQPSLVSPQICRQLFCCVVQQAVEKIDRTRAHAGQVFSQLLYHSPEIPHVPHRDDLLRIFPQSVMDSVIWLAPGSTFPLLTQLLALSTYTYSVLLGLTVSVGGLTESLVKYSAAALLEYLRPLSADSQATQVFSEVVLQIFRDHQKTDRITLPMFKMLDQLLANGCFDIFADEDHSFPQTLLAMTRDEIHRCGEPQKLLASINVFCGLLQFPGKVRTNTLSQLFLLMCHRYPIVRRTTGSSLYESVVMYDDLVEDEHQEELLSILSETQWDRPLDEVRAIRNKLCDMMSVPRPVLKTKQ
ncbi:Tubulin-specific chaperone D [Lamellibrachia satsuma]|nr:Tubulin-specific chaperone D [Lamellibrachia satsuma]